MWKITTRGVTLGEVLILAAMNLLASTDGTPNVSKPVLITTAEGVVRVFKQTLAPHHFERMSVKFKEPPPRPGEEDYELVEMDACLLV